MLQTLHSLKQAVGVGGSRVYVWSNVGLMSHNANKYGGDTYITNDTPCGAVGLFAEVGKVQFKEQLKALPDGTRIWFRVDDKGNVWVGDPSA